MVGITLGPTPCQSWPTHRKGRGVSSVAARGARPHETAARDLRAEDDDGLSSFDRIRHRRYDESVFMWAFDLIEIDGDDLRLEPLGARNAREAVVRGHEQVLHRIVVAAGALEPAPRQTFRSEPLKALEGASAISFVRARTRHPCLRYCVSRATP